MSEYDRLRTRVLNEMLSYCHSRHRPPCDECRKYAEKLLNKLLGEDMA